MGGKVSDRYGQEIILIIEILMLIAGQLDFKWF